MANEVGMPHGSVDLISFGRCQCTFLVKVALIAGQRSGASREGCTGSLKASQSLRKGSRIEKNSTPNHGRSTDITR
jgi:hypothetical protein